MSTRAAVALTFLPFLWKAAIYAQIGSWLPPIVFVFFALLVTFGFLFGGLWARRAARTWCAAMVLWGAARLLLLLLIALTDLNEAHLWDQFNVSFVAVSAAHVAAGLAIYLLVGRANGRRPPKDVNAVATRGEGRSYVSSPEP